MCSLAGAQLRAMLEAVSYKKEIIMTSLLYGNDDLFTDQVRVKCVDPSAVSLRNMEQLKSTAGDQGYVHPDDYR